jgi:transketolase
MLTKKKLTDTDTHLLETFSRSVRRTIVSMLKESQSGHPGGSLSCADFLSLLYTQIISETGEKVVISNGHISPAVYGTLAEMGYIDKAELISGFRKIGYPYEGHVTRHVPGVWYGTGPLGAGVSAGSGFALAEQLSDREGKVYAIIGDGESEEGQVYEMMNFAAKYKLDNFIVFMDYNQVQLTDSLANIMPMNYRGHFEAAGWMVIEADGHDYTDMWRALTEAHSVTGQPVLILGHTIMGKGVDYMEAIGRDHRADWHGKAPKPEEADRALEQLIITDENSRLLDKFRAGIKWKPDAPDFTLSLTPIEIDTGIPMLNDADTLTDCRGAYGKALLDLAQRNSNVLALTADLAGSVKTDGVKRELPDRHIEVGVAEQHMVSLSGGLSLSGFIPFCSTFGVFMTSRAKDQARVNDINETNVKMVATHCGLSVGEDGPTHQAIDDMGSMLGLFHTMMIEPADPNQCDHMVRYIASHYGNFYMRMGRHPIPTLTREDGSVFFDSDYRYTYGRCDILREGSDITIIATGATVIEALRARAELSGMSIEIVIVSSIKEFDDRLRMSIEKTKNILTVEDHNTHSGLASQVSAYIIAKGLSVEKMLSIGVDGYQLSGTSRDLYRATGIDSTGIVNTIKNNF